MNTPALTSPSGQQVRCWCGETRLEDFSPDYVRCPACQTLVLREMRGEEISEVRDDEHDFYGKGYYLHHVQEDYGLPDLETRARADLPERCLHWLRTVLKFVPGPGARTLELGCGHGGFVAMQRWAGLDATGLELSPWLVGKAREWFGVPVLTGRLEDQQLAPGDWDAVVLMDVLEHLPDPRRTLGQAVSLLRSPGGFLLIQTPCYPLGWSYEALVAHEHPFLQQLKPLEHLYLFSEQAVKRLCAELGVGEVVFEPAIFAHYDLFAVASANPLRARPRAERTEMLMAASPPARWTLALLDLGDVRDDLAVRLAASHADCAAVRQTAEKQHEETIRLQTAINDLRAQLDAGENARNLLAAQFADLQGHFTAAEGDRAARLTIIEQQGAETTRLHAEVDRQVQAANELWPKLDTAVNARNLLAAEMEELRGHFAHGEADRQARLEVIESQGSEIASLHAEVNRRLGELGELWPKLDTAVNARNLLAAEMEELRGHFARGEADRQARLDVIESQGGEIASLHAEVNRRLGELEELWPKLDAAGHARNLAVAQLEDLGRHFESLEADRSARLEVIQRQGGDLGRLQVELNGLQGRLKQSETDGADHLRAIETQRAEIARLQAEGNELRPRLEQAVRQHESRTAQLSRSEADGAALHQVVGEHERTIARLQTQLASTETARETLHKRKKTLDAHWTAWLLKRLRLWPLD